MDTPGRACFTGAPSASRSHEMTRFHPLAVVAALACTLLAAPEAAAEKRIYGLTQAATSNTLHCAAESSLGLGAYLLYETGHPLEKTLPVALATEAAKSEPKEVERRVRAVYAAKPTSPANWGTQVFQNCLVMKSVPLDYTRTGNCYLLTFYLATVVTLHRDAGRTDQQILDQMISPKADANFRAHVLKLIAEYGARGIADPRKNSIDDLGRFLQCVSPTQPAVSNS
jgi:hypothetical protein